MSGFFGRLEVGEELDARPYFDGPWDSFRRTVIAEHTTGVFDADGKEFSVFVLTGRGTYTNGTITRMFHPGSSLTVALGARLELRSTTETEVFVTTLTVTPEGNA